MTDFSRSATTHDDTTGAISVVTTTITGVAIRVRANASELAQFAAGGLTSSETAVLFWTPDTYGDRPRPGDTVTWEEVTWTARYVSPIAPDGVTIAARVGVSR